MKNSIYFPNENKRLVHQWQSRRNTVASLLALRNWLLQLPRLNSTIELVSVQGWAIGGWISSDQRWRNLALCYLSSWQHKINDTQSRRCTSLSENIYLYIYIWYQVSIKMIAQSITLLPYSSGVLGYVRVQSQPIYFRDNIRPEQPARIIPEQQYQLICWIFLVTDIPKYLWRPNIFPRKYELAKAGRKITHNYCINTWTLMCLNNYGRLNGSCTWWCVLMYFDGCVVVVTCGHSQPSRMVNMCILPCVFQPVYYMDELTIPYMGHESAVFYRITYPVMARKLLDHDMQFLLHCC